MDTSIILSLIALAGSVVTTVLVGWKKREQDATSIRFDNVSKAIEIWENVAIEANEERDLYRKLLIQKTEELTDATNRLAQAIYDAKACVYSDTCAVLRRLQGTTDTHIVRTDSHGDGKGKSKRHHDSVASGQGDATGTAGM